MSDPSSDSLLHRWQQDGDRHALDRLLQTELPRLREQLRRENPSLLGPSVGPTDAANEAVQRLLEREEEVHFESAPPLRSYLLQSARRFLIDRFRRRRRRTELVEPEELEDHDTPARAAESADAAAEVLAAFRGVSWRDREILGLVYLHQLSVAEAAAEIGITPEAAHMRLSRARASLREVLERRARREAPGSRPPGA
jgi:RNA polymerase sigma-70 factor (ECF subfamily)